MTTTPYKPSSNGSVERFHAYLAQAISHAVSATHDDWDTYIDGVLFAYRTTPLDGMNVSPFEIVYGREPNLPIDNIIARNDWTEPIENPVQHIQAVTKARETLYPFVHEQRRKRFERNKRADGTIGTEHRMPHYPVGSTVYLHFPKGRFRPLGGSTKFSDVNGGPYTVLEIRNLGMVYSSRRSLILLLFVFVIFLVAL